MSTKQWNFSCQRQRAGAGDLRGQAADWDKILATKSHGQVTDSERPGTGRDAGEGRGRDWDEIPAGAEVGTGRDADGGLGLEQDAEDQINSKESAL